MPRAMSFCSAPGLLCISRAKHTVALAWAGIHSQLFQVTSADEGLHTWSDKQALAARWSRMFVLVRFPGLFLSALFLSWHGLHLTQARWALGGVFSEPLLCSADQGSPTARPRKSHVPRQAGGCFVAFCAYRMSACCWSCHTDTACAYVATACPETTATPEEPTAVVCGWWARILLWLGVASMPTCRVWAAPASIKVLHQVAQQLGQCRSNTGAPEDLATPNLSDGSRIVDPGEGTAVDLPATHDLQAEFRGNWLGVSTRR